MSRQPQALDYTSGTISNSAVNIFEMGSALVTSAPTGARSFVGTIESAAVLMPIEDQWRMLVPDFRGDPQFYDIKKGALDHLPMPNEENSVEAPIGHYRVDPDEEK